MCGRYVLATSLDVIGGLFNVLDGHPLIEPRYNIAPTQTAPVIRNDASGRRSIDLLLWGLVPSWADDRAVGSRMINARAETLADKSAFREAYRSRRCIVPADGFYEWKSPLSGRGLKQPYFIHSANRLPFAFAGLWEQWTDGAARAEPVESFTIITTEPNQLVRPIHHRMPVILAQDAVELWMNPDVLDAADLHHLLQPLPEAAMRLHPVSTRVNSTDQDGPDCIEPVDETEPELF